MFGQPVQLNFNRKGEVFNTLPGGIFGILVRITVTCYIIYQGGTWINKGNDTIYTYKTQSSTRAIGSTNLK